MAVDGNTMTRTGSRSDDGRFLKGLVLSGGKGSRLRPLTATGAKQLVPVANKPVLFYALEQLVEAGIHEIGIVTGDTGLQVQAAVGDGTAFGARITYIPQPEPLGLAHAILTARDWLADDPFCMFLGDNFLMGGIATHARAFARSNCSAQILLKQVENPSAFGVAILNGNGLVERLVEKPAEPISNLAIVGVYFFRPQIHDVTADLQPSARGELEITDAIQRLVECGQVVQPAILEDNWIDTGRKDDLIEANRLVLLTLSRKLDGQIDAESTITGEVVIEPGAVVTRSTVLGPAVVGAETRVTDSYVGPFTAIGDRCELRGCEIEHSIVMEGSVIHDVGVRIAESLIGREVVIGDSRLKPRAMRLMLGDHSQVGVVT
jgi:glucose-1-phosphate thymidylyltransferase